MVSGTQVLEGEREKRQPTSLTKTCPRCGAVVFADMDVCYGCLYDFTRPSLDYPGSGTPEGEISPPAAEAAPHPVATPRIVTSAPAIPKASAPHAMASAALLEAPPLAPREIVEEVPSEAPREEGADAARSTGGGRFFLRVRWRGVEVLVPLEGAGLTIGRLPQSEIVLSDFTVCDEHARIALSGEHATVVLMDRRARATKDGADVRGSTELAAGEELDIAGARFALVRRECE